jgi:hypothetical protein
MNNKMKKFNKILMMTVAILLTLVLASTSVVSGIFAKYVVTKSATTKVSLKAFGITLTVEGKSGLSVVTTPSGTSGVNTMSVTVNNLQLTPGQTIDDVVKFTIAANGTDNKPNVSNVKLKIKTTVSGVDKFNVTSDNLEKVTSETVTHTTGKYIPIIFTMESGTADAANSTKILDAWNNPTSVTDTTLATAIAKGIKDANFGYTATSGVSNSVEKTIWNGTGTTLSVTHLSFGFKGWGKETPSVDNADAIQTYLSTDSDAVLTVTYTVSLEQVV